MSNWIWFGIANIGQRVENMYLSHLLMEQVEGKLKSDCLHVGPLEGGRDVHVHVKEPGQQ